MVVPRSKGRLDRREFSIAGGVSLAALAYAGRIPSTLAQGSPIVVADPGAPWTEAFTMAYHEPFREETGIDTEAIAREHEPLAAIRSMVETEQYIWDVTVLTRASARILAEEDLLEDLNYEQPGINTDEFLEDAILPYWMGVYVYASVMAYRNDALGDNGPQSWADFWDVEGFPGRRALRRAPQETLEQALMADGVAREDLYPLDLDRAFAKLDEIKPHVEVWWTSGAQASQLLQSGEVDMLPCWSNRHQAVIDTGTPATVVWNQGIYSMDGWVLPKGGPNTDVGQQWVAFVSDAERSAAWTEMATNGPVNQRSYDFIDEERAQLLPTYPENFELLVRQDDDWWNENQADTIERFEAWLLE